MTYLSTKLAALEPEKALAPPAGAVTPAAVAVAADMTAAGAEAAATAAADADMAAAAVADNADSSPLIESEQDLSSEGKRLRIAGLEAEEPPPGPFSASQSEKE